MAYESEILISKYKNELIENNSEFDFTTFPIGEDKEQLVKIRVNQCFFRSTILSSYNLRCCITELSIPSLLVASHIKPWFTDRENRTNPHNGLCLNSIHDKAFNRGLISVTPDFKVKISDYFSDFENDIAVKDFFVKFDNTKILLPNRFLPYRDFLSYHYNNVFIK